MKNSDNEISRTPFTGSQKIYVDGKLHPIKVAMREINLHDTKLSNGEIERNPVVTIYDTSGPYTDQNIDIDIRKGLPRIREQWILDRNDVEELKEISSDYGQQRLNNKELEHLRFEYLHKPLRAKKGANVSQLYYAKKGISPQKWNISRFVKISNFINLKVRILKFQCSMRAIVLVQTRRKEKLLRSLSAVKLRPEERLFQIISTIPKVNQ